MGQLYWLCLVGGGVRDVGLGGRYGRRAVRRARGVMGGGGGG